MRTAILLGAIPIAIAGILALGTGLPVSLVLGHLAVGWAAYLARVTSRMTVSLAGILTASVCLIGLTVGLHGFLRWLTVEVRIGARPPDAAPRSWKFRWTASAVAVIVLMFASGIAAVGIVHQCGWLLAPGPPLERLKLGDSFVGHGDSALHLKEMGFAAQYLLQSDGVAEGRDLQSWQTRILPMLGMRTAGPLHDDLPWDHPANSAYFRGIVPFYLNPEVGAIRDEQGYALSHYAGNAHVLGHGGRGDTSSTMLAGESAGHYKPWGDPGSLRDPNLGINASADGFGGPSGTGANVVFLDGSVRFIRKTVNPKVLRALSGRD